MDRARKNVLLLSVAQALSMAGMIMVVTSSALAGHLLAVDKALATVPIALQFTATMATTIPASLLMARIGRRAGFMAGIALQLAGALLSAYALMIGAFWLFCCGGLLLGAANGFSMYYRFAAADTADEAFRPKAISLVMAGGVAAALMGPEFARYTRDALAPVPFAGAFAAIGVLSVLNFVVLAFLDIPRPARARFNAGRPMAVILRQPVFLVAVMGGMVSYGIMTLVMTATPLAMAACNHAFEDSAFVIQWHALGMFAPAFFTGSLVKRFGTVAVMQAGAALLLGSVATNLSGITVAQFWSGLVLLGVGWNFLFVGATTLLTETYRPDERAKVQAINDFLVFTSSAVASFSAGALQYRIGWESLNLAAVPFLVLVVGALVWVRGHRRNAAVA